MLDGLEVQAKGMGDRVSSLTFVCKTCGKKARRKMPFGIHIKHPEGGKVMCPNGHGEMELAKQTYKTIPTREDKWRLGYK